MAHDGRISMRARARLGAGVVLLALVIGAPRADAGYRVERDFFERTSHDFIDFETRGDGSPVNLDEGDVGGIPFNEYPGLAFFSAKPFWGNDPNDDVESALEAAGSLQHMLIVVPTSNDPPRMVFLTNVPDVHAVGLSVLFNREAGAEPPVITVLGEVDSQLAVLDEIQLGDILEGSSGVIDYGFLGYTSEHRIVGLEFSTTDFVSFDDLRRSSIPAPASSLVFVLAGGALRPRRHR